MDFSDNISKNENACCETQLKRVVLEKKRV